MSEKIPEQISKNSEMTKRNKQYDILKEWYDGKITGRECIQKIVELEKVFFLYQGKKEL
jgi:hypothetical protein